LETIAALNIQIMAGGFGGYAEFLNITPQIRHDHKRVDANHRSFYFSPYLLTGAALTEETTPFTITSNKKR
jgi:hypothetical protein